MGGDKEAQAFPPLAFIGMPHHQEPPVPEGTDPLDFFLQEGSRNLGIEVFKPHCRFEHSDDPISQPRPHPRNHFLPEDSSDLQGSPVLSCLLFNPE
jgi:hypothetical protein